MDTTFEIDVIDPSKVEIVKRKKRSKSMMWLGFLLFGWSYGSLGKPIFQIAWYAGMLFSIYNLQVTYQSGIFDEYSSMAIVSSFIMTIWYIFRLFTLNKDIRRYNKDLADFFYLTAEERIEAGIE